LDAVAGRQDHRLLDRVLVDRTPIGLGDVVVGERESLEQIDGGESMGDAEGEDGHEWRQFYAPAPRTRRGGRIACGSIPAISERLWGVRACNPGGRGTTGSRSAGCRPGVATPSRTSQAFAWATRPSCVIRIRAARGPSGPA